MCNCLVSQVFISNYCFCESVAWMFDRLSMMVVHPVSHSRDTTVFLSLHKLLRRLQLLIRQPYATLCGRSRYPARVVPYGSRQSLTGWCISSGSGRRYALLLTADRDNRLPKLSFYGTRNMAPEAKRAFPVRTAGCRCTDGHTSAPVFHPVGMSGRGDLPGIL